MQQDEIIKGNKSKAISRIFIFLLVVTIIGCIYAFFWNTQFKWHEETEDAYVNSHQNVVTSQVSGNIVKIMVDDTDEVEKGQLIAVMDKTDYTIAIENATVELENSIRKYYALENNTLVSKNTLNAKKTDFIKNEADFKRDSLSFKNGLISKEQYDTISNNYNQSKIQYEIAQNNYNNELVQSFSSSLKTHPEVQKSIINLKKAYIDLGRTDIRATFDGMIAKRSIYLGQKINANQSLFTIVDLKNSWVDANMKETQLKNLKLGQHVEITSDINKKVYEGSVVGVSAGSGSAFSLLPAQNATGNWIKVVQRIPVKVSINPESIKENGTLPIGSSVIVDINTHQDQTLKILKPTTVENTEIFNADYNSIDSIINTIINDNVLKLNK